MNHICLDGTGFLETQGIFFIKSWFIFLKWQQSNNVICLGFRNRIQLKHLISVLSNYNPKCVFFSFYYEKKKMLKLLEGYMKNEGHQYAEGGIRICFIQHSLHLKGKFLSILTNYCVKWQFWLPYICFTHLQITAFWQNIHFIFITTKMYTAKFYFLKVGFSRYLWKRTFLR